MQMETLSVARRTRLHRTSAAQFLASLESSCSIDELAQINWATLEKVPHWCFTENASRDKLQLVAGTVFLAPLIAQWIDGALLKQARTLVGPNYFDVAMQVGSNRSIAEPVNTSEAVPELLASAGASVLVCSVDNLPIRKLLSGQFPMAIKNIDEKIARSVYQLSLDVIEHVQRQSPPVTTGEAATGEAAAAVTATQVSVEKTPVTDANGQSEVETSQGSG